MALLFVLPACGTQQGLLLTSSQAQAEKPSQLDGAKGAAQLHSDTDPITTTEHPARRLVTERKASHSTERRRQVKQSTPSSAKSANDEVGLSPIKADSVDAGQPMVTPKIGSPEWQKQQDLDDKREKELDRRIRGICNNC